MKLTAGGGKAGEGKQGLMFSVLEEMELERTECLQSAMRTGSTLVRCLWESSFLPRPLAPSPPHTLAPSLPHSLTSSLPHSLTPSPPHTLTPSLLHTLTGSQKVGTKNLNPQLCSGERRVKKCRISRSRLRRFHPEGCCLFGHDRRQSYQGESQTPKSPPPNPIPPPTTTNLGIRPGFSKSPNLTMYTPTPA